MDTLTTHAADTTTEAVTETPQLPTHLPRIAEPREVAPEDARALSKAFFERLRTLDEGTHERQYVRNTLIEMNLSLVQFAARRFRNRTDGTDIEDIIQVGTIGLIKAIDRFDPTLGNEFTTLALPYITGEIKRHFRDTTWAVRVPRRLQELRIALARGKEELHAVLDRAPTVRELAEHLDITEEEAVEGLVAANGHSSQPLEQDTDESSDTAARPLAEILGNEDPAIELFEDFRTLAPLLNQLEGRERLILQMRFGQEMTQAQIGERLGISQMQISRLLTRTLTRLREGMLAD
ncbi:SigB/SigF/SigG family RNA polymerase sigma factor [Streptomyces sp. NPDC058623]|uniref:SigB/SigF/SigG family RNA polymerase sigma factor n=1 Tax=Streptomyces sp. NPDC058623 TaxID=3346563 RepID=UPI003656C5B6